MNIAELKKRAAARNKTRWKTATVNIDGVGELAIRELSQSSRLKLLEIWEKAGLVKVVKEGDAIAIKANEAPELDAASLQRIHAAQVEACVHGIVDSEGRPYINSANEGDLRDLLNSLDQTEIAEISQQVMEFSQPEDTEGN